MWILPCGFEVVNGFHIDGQNNLTRLTRQDPSAVVPRPDLVWQVPNSDEVRVRRLWGEIPHLPAAILGVKLSLSCAQWKIAAKWARGAFLLPLLTPSWSSQDTDYPGTLMKWVSQDIPACCSHYSSREKKKGRSGFSGFPTPTSKPGIKPRSRPVPERRVLKCQEVIPKVPGALLWHHPAPCTVNPTQWVLCQLKKIYSPGNDKDWDGWLSRENALLEISHQGERWGHSSSAVYLAPSII